MKGYVPKTEYVQKTLSEEKITDDDIFKARNEHQLEKMRRNREDSNWGFPLDVLGVNTQ